MSLHATLETTLGQRDGFCCQLPFKCYLPGVVSVGDGLKFAPGLPPGWLQNAGTTRVGQRCLCRQVDQHSDVSGKRCLPASKAHRLLYHSTIGSRVIEKRRMPAFKPQESSVQLQASDANRLWKITGSTHWEVRGCNNWRRKPHPIRFSNLRPRHSTLDL